MEEGAWKRIPVLGLLALLGPWGCRGIPAGLAPVEGFEVDRYLGRWYEIARLDHAFERGLDRVTADYSLRPDGTLRVVNRGHSTSRGEWKQAEGRATFAGAHDRGHLQVSFFVPFYASYIVFGLDREGYRHALVSGPDRSYLWILARTPVLAPELRSALVAKAKAQGFDTDRLTFVDQTPLPVSGPEAVAP